MKQEKSNYNILIGVTALVVIVLTVSVVGFVVIDSPEIRSKIAEAAAAKAAATAQKDKAYNGARSEQITGAYEMYQKAKVGEQVMRKSYERIKSLHDEKVVSDQKYDEVLAQYQAAKATTRAARSQWEMAVKGARQEDKDAAVALVERANAAVELVNSYLDEIRLTSPCDGVVASIYPKVGELVGQGSPIRLHGMQSGDRIDLTIPALDGRRISATVYYISARESYATWKATRETGEFDTRTFEVRARPDYQIPGLRPGMSAIMTVESGK